MSEQKPIQKKITVIHKGSDKKYELTMEQLMYVLTEQNEDYMGDDD